VADAEGEVVAEAAVAPVGEAASAVAAECHEEAAECREGAAEAFLVARPPAAPGRLNARRLAQEGADVREVARVLASVQADPEEAPAAAALPHCRRVQVRAIARASEIDPESATGPESADGPELVGNPELADDPESATGPESVDDLALVTGRASASGLALAIDPASATGRASATDLASASGLASATDLASAAALASATDLASASGPEEAPASIDLWTRVTGLAHRHTTAGEARTGATTRDGQTATGTATTTTTIGDGARSAWVPRPA
jgi:hypothetical protein